MTFEQQVFRMFLQHLINFNYKINNFKCFFGIYSLTHSLVAMPSYHMHVVRTYNKIITSLINSYIYYTTYGTPKEMQQQNYKSFKAC